MPPKPSRLSGKDKNPDNLSGTRKQRIPRPRPQGSPGFAGLACTPSSRLCDRLRRFHKHPSQPQGPRRSLRPDNPRRAARRRPRNRIKRRKKCPHKIRRDQRDSHFQGLSRKARSPGTSCTPRARRRPARAPRFRGGRGGAGVFAWRQDAVSSKAGRGETRAAKGSARM